MNKKNMDVKKNMKNYSRVVYRRAKIKKGRTYRFFRWVFLFLFVAAVSYLITLLVYSIINRQHCTHIEIDDSYAEEPNKNNFYSKSKNKAGVKNLNLDIKAVEMPKNLIFNEAAFKKFLRSTKESGENAVIVTFKDEGGNLLYKSDVALAHEWGTILHNAVDPLKIVELIKEYELTPIVKINAFLDGKAPFKDLDNTFLYDEYNRTKIFSFYDKDRGKQQTYLNPCKKLARRYILDIVKEVKNLGFQYVILENFSFPNCEFSEKMEDYDRIDRSYVLREVIKDLKKTNANLIFGYDCDVLYKEGEEKKEFCYGKEPDKLGIDLNMLILYRYEDFEKYKERIVQFANSRQNSSFILKLEFNKNSEKVLQYLKENSLDSYVVLKQN